ncbi:hypothetical protein SLS58_008474 [Diplodia intermedia]|uniref:Zn(2)-C6 fungal-type domain-containing protein n=1 Tax=Diplodia intermedia TaxID=856260 RepID=A0ABR3THM7_9PEZI
MDSANGSPSIPGLTLQPDDSNAQLNVQPSVQPDSHPSEEQQTNHAGTLVLDESANKHSTADQQAAPAPTVAIDPQTTTITDEQTVSIPTAAKDYQKRQTSEPALQSLRRSGSSATPESDSTFEQPSESDIEQVAVPRRCLRCKNLKKGCTGEKPCAVCIRAKLAAEECVTDAEYDTAQRRRRLTDKKEKPSNKPKKAKRQSSVGAGKSAHESCKRKSLYCY